MKKADSLCEIALERIKTLFSQGKSQLFSQSWGSLLRSHHCNLVKMPRVPKVHQLALLGYEMTKEKKKIQGVSWDKENISVQMPFSTTSSAGELKSERFQRYKLKEHVLASKRLKNLKKEQKQEMGQHQISLLSQSSANSKDKPREIDYWEDFLRKKEERHFNLTRITKILTD